MIHNKTFKFIEKLYGHRLMTYSSVSNNIVFHHIHKDVEYDIIEFHIKEPAEKINRIFEYFKIETNSKVKFKHVNLENAVFISNQFPNEVLIYDIGFICGVYYSDVCSDELKTMIELMEN